MTAPRPAVLVTRPEPEASRLAARLREGGYDALVSPLLEIEREARLTPDDLSGVQAILLTSPRAAEAAGEDLSPGLLAPIPALCVGDATAEAARRAGFSEISSAQGDAVDLLALTRRMLRPEGGKLLILRPRDAAKDFVPPLSEAGFEVSAVQLYRAELARGLRPEAVKAFVDKRVDAVLLMSERTAHRFKDVIGAARTPAGEALDLSSAVAICISERTAQTAREASFGRVVAAETPDLDAMLRVLDAILGGKASRTERLY